MTGPEPGAAQAYADAATAVRQTAVPAAPQVLRDRYGVDPEDSSVVLDLAAMAITHACWRNTVVEDAHALGAIDDADQIVSNIDAWRVVREGTGGHPRWWTPDPPATAASLADAKRLIAGRALTTRLRGTGIRTAALRQQVRRRLWHQSALADHLGGPDALPLFALAGAIACGHWYGTPWWPQLCQTYRNGLHDLTDHTQPGAAAAARRLLAHPDTFHVLVVAPDRLDHATRDDLISTGLGYTRLPHDTTPVAHIPNAHDALAAAAVLGM